ncbi:ephrin-A3 isoform X3 [Lagenorhynchus albirostris]|uniref:ephrin-A3 isoform X3 n=1 Tax=Lagenorhynchus albirostris TaxID=27610 RepID=UPI0028EBD684|nr:ephrin-A3 isoform X3 [Lagenorhynchus albirostris]
METSGVGIRPLPPGPGLGEIRGALGADSPAQSSSSPSPRLTRPPPAPLESGGGRGAESAQVWTGRDGRGRAPGREAAAAPASLPPPLLPLCPGSPAPSLRQPRPHKSLRREGYTVQVNVNDYLDIYCPHYNSSGVGPGAGPGPGGGAEQYVLYMVSRAGYRTCNASQGFKRWECNRPHAPHSPIKFSEKFQRYSAFSLGYEFHAGHEYYYISTPTHNLHWKCLRMKVFVCCASTSHSGEKPVPTLPQFTMGPNVKINVLEDFEGENPQVPKLEKSISGTSPKREHLPLAPLSHNY